MTELLLVGETEWQQVESMEEARIRISDHDGRSGLAGFYVTFTDGSVAGITSQSIAGVRAE